MGRLQATSAEAWDFVTLHAYSQPKCALALQLEGFNFGEPGGAAPLCLLPACECCCVACSTVSPMCCRISSGSFAPTLLGPERCVVASTSQPIDGVSVSAAHVTQGRCVVHSPLWLLNSALRMPMHAAAATMCAKRMHARSCVLAVLF